MTSQPSVSRTRDEQSPARNYHQEQPGCKALLPVEVSLVADREDEYY